MTELARRPGTPPRTPAARRGPVTTARRPVTGLDRTWRAPAVALGALAYFVVTEPRPALTALGMLALAGLVVTLNAFTRSAADRAELALAASLALYLAVPVGRIPNSSLLLTLDVAAGIAIAASGLFGRGAPAGHGRWIVLTMYGSLAAVTAVSPDEGALKRYALVAVAAVPAFLLANALPREHLRRTILTLVLLACFEAVLALVEPVAFPQHLWAPAQLGSSGQVVPLLNEVIGGGLERSQGTLGHPLPLGFVLVAAIALTARSLADLRFPVRASITALLLLGLLMAGARNALLTALLIVLMLSSSPRLHLVRVGVGTALLALGVGFAIQVAVLTPEAIDAFTESGSYYHRLAAYSAFGRLLFDQSIANVFFGHGFAATPRVFESGLLQTDGFNTVDNMFVLMLVQGGLVCLLLLVALCVLGLVRAGSALRPAVLAVVVTLFIFDALVWPSAAVVSMTVLGAALRRRSAEEDDAPARGT